jgi:hypothetical protein
MWNRTDEDRLREVITQPDTVLFVGAGVSAWAGLPTWPRLIEELADFVTHRRGDAQLVRRELAHGDLLQAASYGFDSLTLPEQAEFLRTACRHGRTQPSELHRRLSTLGPRCFITTNYDKLLERALAMERPDLTFQLVTNVNLVETATIVQSRDFVFKPHGDIDTTESVILTREQYRVLHGEKRHVYEAFKTLLASRPIVYVGFGLRDPDFLLIKDTLAIVYQGAAQEHYAIVADAEEQEVAYWRKNYGVHLLSYATAANAPNAEAGHADLLALLNAAAAPHEPDLAPERAGPNATLALLRHARRMQQLAPLAEGGTIPLLASHVRRHRSWAWHPNVYALFDRHEAVAALEGLTSSILLTGAPGAGKTHVVRAAAARLSERLIEVSLEGQDGSNARVPAYLDMRDYTGDLVNMAIETFPVGAAYESVVAEGRVTFFVDGLNEVPADMGPDDIRADLVRFLDWIGDCAAVFVTRFGEELADLELPEVELDAITSDYLEEHLPRLGLPLDEVSDPLHALLRRPFFYRLFAAGVIPSEVRTPHAVYLAVFDRLTNRFAEAFGSRLDLTSLFSGLAYQHVDAGSQVIRSDELIATLQSVRPRSDAALEIFNWLLVEDVLVPRPDSSVAFFHHSVIEHLAARELAERFKVNTNSVRRCLRSTHWNNTVLLTLGFLERVEQKALLDEVFFTDPAFGLRGLAYVEHDWEEWTSEGLHRVDTLTLTFEDQFDIADALSDLRVTTTHEHLLLRLYARGDAIGGAALAKATTVAGADGVTRAIDALFDHPDDYNQATAIARVLPPLIQQADIEYLVDRLRSFEHLASGTSADGDPFERAQGLVSAAGHLVACIDLAPLRQSVGPLNQVPDLLRQVILERLQEDGSRAALEMTAAFLESAPAEASVALHFQLAYAGVETPHLDVLVPDESGPSLLAAIHSPNGAWAISDLRMLAGRSAEWLGWARAQAAENRNGLLGALLAYAAQDDDTFFEILAGLAADPPDWSKQPTVALQHCSDLSWADQASLLVSLLRTPNDRFVWDVLEGFSFSSVHGAELATSDLSLGAIEPWVRRIARAGNDTVGFFFRDRLGRFLGEVASAEDRVSLLRMLQSAPITERRALVDHILPHVRGLTLREIPDDGLSWALEDLAQREVDAEDTLLGTIATEEFVESVILPRLRGTDAEPLRSNLFDLARSVGSRHGRRYVTQAGEVLE